MVNPGNGVVHKKKASRQLFLLRWHEPATE
jgi:hypothetical protein